MKQVYSVCLLLAVILCAVSGCSRSNPVAELQQAIEKYRAISKTARDFQFDVRKTDSVVSPYVGTIDYTLDWNNEEGKPIGRVKCAASFAYQQGKWIAKNVVGVVVEAVVSSDKEPDLESWGAVFEVLQAPKEVRQWQDALDMRAVP